MLHCLSVCLFVCLSWFGQARHRHQWHDVIITSFIIKIIKSKSSNHQKVFNITHFWCSERENSFQSSLLWRWNLTQCRAFNLIKSRSCGCNDHMIIIIPSYNHVDAVIIWASSFWQWLPMRSTHWHLKNVQDCATIAPPRQNKFSCSNLEISSKNLIRGNLLDHLVVFSSIKYISRLCRLSLSRFWFHLQMKKWRWENFKDQQTFKNLPEPGLKCGLPWQQPARSPEKNGGWILIDNF